MSDIFETAIVQKRNVLNELRSNNLSLQELRFFSIYLSKINPRDINTRTVKFKLSDFQKIMNFKELKISQLKAATDSLLTKLVHIPKESGGYSTFQLFKKCDVDKDELGEWYVSIDAHDDALSLMFDFKDKYFKYELWNALRLKSANQIRMYEILKQYETIGKREIKVDDLQQLLGTNYTRWDKFKSNVLEPCKKALKQFSDICYTYERGKAGQGGKWLTIIFHISKNTDYDGQTTIYELNLQSYINLDSHKEPEELEKIIEPDLERGDLDFYSGACNNEFTANEIESLLAVINTMELPQHEMGAAFAKYHYLLEQYTRFKAIAERTAINNRYSYFYTMLVSDRDKQRCSEI